MARYYVNMIAQQNGDHEVHREGCQWMPSVQNRIDLGDHNSCHTAVAAANAYYRQVNGCATCSSACHTR